NLYYHTSPLLEIFFVSLGGAKKTSLKPHALSKASMCYEPAGHVTHKKRPGKTWPEDNNGKYWSFQIITLFSFLQFFFVNLAWNSPKSSPSSLMPFPKLACVTSLKGT
ncbi:MAG: hypothetical protein LBF22_00610, partial [Deltaproteobacteria bacterium]|nr:hypothetical protein [Deltaproteobacteria bacterium]